MPPRSGIRSPTRANAPPELPSTGEKPRAPESVSFGDQLANSDALAGMLQIAHDMRSPLSAILLLVDPMRRGKQGPVTPAQERQLGIIYGAALSLSTLANDIIDAARGTHRAPAVMRPFSIREIIQQVCAVVRPIAEEKQLDLQTTYAATDGRLGDAAALHRVLLNLTSNALKYTEHGSVAVGCTEHDGALIEFWVNDTGTGVPAPVLAMLSNATGAGAPLFTSSGLGLAICRTLLESMGSALHVATSAERGTRFSFVLSLPFAPSAPGNSQQAQLLG